MLSQARKANRNRQAVLKEHAAYHNTNPEKSAVWLYLPIWTPQCLWHEGGFCKRGLCCSVLQWYSCSAKVGFKHVSLSLTHAVTRRTLLKGTTITVRLQHKRQESSPAAASWASETPLNRNCGCFWQKWALTWCGVWRCTHSSLPFSNTPPNQ